MLPDKLKKYPKIASLLKDNPEHAAHYANLADDALQNFEKLLTNDPKLYQMLLKNKLPPVKERMFSDAPDRPSSGSSLGAG